MLSSVLMQLKRFSQLPCPYTSAKRSVYSYFCFVLFIRVLWVFGRYHSSGRQFILNSLLNSLANGSAKTSTHSHRRRLLMLSGPFALFLGRAFNTFICSWRKRVIVDNLKSPFNKRGGSKKDRYCICQSFNIDRRLHFHHM